jgi:hypothetical protein
LKSSGEDKRSRKHKQLQQSARLACKRRWYAAPRLQPKPLHCLFPPPSAPPTYAIVAIYRAPRITVKDRVKAVVSIVWRGREGYVEYMDGVSRCPTGLSQERADSDIRRLNLDVEKEFAEAVHSQESEATLPEVWPLQVRACPAMQAFASAGRLHGCDCCLAYHAAGTWHGTCTACCAC